MTSHKERVERLEILAERKRVLLEEGNSEVLTRHILDDYMINIFWLGHQTRADYMDVLFRSQTVADKASPQGAYSKEWKSALD
tara:strand:- start:277 stop:525 length:249 start_codon:yes stop_codon:yes gene_type:complete